MKTKLLFTVLITAISYLAFAQTTSIPDPNFEQALIDLGIDSDGIINGQVLTADIENVLELDVQGKNIADLTGIEDMPSLQLLHCQDNQLTSLDVTQNSILWELWCDDNQLTSLNLTQNVGLSHLYCSDNLLTSLDLSQNINLTRIHCLHNQITSLDITQNIELTNLKCNFNQLISLDVTQNTLLTSLEARDNFLTSLDLSQNISLTWVKLSYNQLNSLDVTQNINLNSLQLGDNQLSSIDVSQNVHLDNLALYSNLLTSVDITQNVNLISLQLGYNQLTNFDILNNPLLESLTIHSNLLETLNLKNGNTVGITNMWSIDNPNLECIQVDTDIVGNIPEDWEYDAGVSFSDDCEYLGVNVSELGEIAIYPNPTKDKIMVSVENGDAIQSLQLFSVTGKQLLVSKTSELNLTNLPNGIYLLKVKTERGIAVKKVIKN